MSKQVILVGGFQDIIEHCEEENIEIIGIIDNIKTDSYLGYKILGKDEDAENLFNIYGKIPLIIVPDLPSHRKRLTNFYKNIGFNFSNLISSKTMISKSVQIGTGVIIRKGGNISCGTKIGDFVHINTMANITHDVIINDFCSIAPGATILGYVKIGEESWIGANSTILPKIKLGLNTIVGAQAVVTKDVPDNNTVVGIPAKSIN